MSGDQNQEWRGKIGRMSQGEINSFLAEGIVCRLGCHDSEGWPYVVPVWFQYEDDGFYIIPRERSAWAKYLEDDPRAFLCIDDSTPPSRKVMVRGQARMIERPNVGGRWVDIGRRMSYRYLGEHGPDYLVPTLDEPRWLFFVEPQSVKTWQGVDWAKKYKHSDW